MAFLRALATGDSAIRFVSFLPPLIHTAQSLCGFIAGLFQISASQREDPDRLLAAVLIPLALATYALPFAALETGPSWEHCAKLLPRFCQTGC